MAQNQKSYDNEFKAQAVKLAQEIGGHKAAQELGIPKGTMYTWIIILEGALDQEMDEELGYSKYDYRNKETDNSRNGHSQKTMHTSYGDMEIDIPRDRKGEFEPQIVKKFRRRALRTWKQRSSPCTPKE